MADVAQQAIGAAGTLRGVDMNEGILIVGLIGGIGLLVLLLVPLLLLPFSRATRRFERIAIEHKQRGVEVSGQVVDIQRAEGVIYRSRDGDPYFIDLDLTLPSGRVCRSRAYLVALPPSIARYQIGAEVRALVLPDDPELATLVGVVATGS